MRKQLGAAAAALAALVAVSVALTTPAGAATEHPDRSGSIAFYAYTKIYAIQPNGTDLRVLVPAGRRNCVIPDGQDGQCAIYAFVWSPDGKRLAFLHGSSEWSLYVIDADGRGERRVSGCGHPWPSCGDFSWSPDGSQLVVSRYDGLFVVSADGRAVRQLTRSRHDSSPRWSPDGSHIAFVRSPAHGPGSSPAIYVIPSRGSRATRLAHASSSNELQWTPDSTSLVFLRGGRLLKLRADGSHPPVSLVDRGVSGHVSVSPDGTAVAYNSPHIVHRKSHPHDATIARPEIWTATSRGRKRWRVYAGTLEEDGDLPLAPVWSPRGKRLAFADDALYVVNADGSHLRRLSTLAHESMQIGLEIAWEPIP